MSTLQVSNSMLYNRVTDRQDVMMRRASVKNRVSMKNHRRWKLLLLTRLVMKFVRVT